MSLTVNGTSYNFSGNNMVISNGKVMVNGKDITDLNDIDQKEITIVIESDIDYLKVDHCHSIVANAYVEAIETISGSVHCAKDVCGSITTMSGSVRCKGEINGSVSTMSGNINKGEK